MRTPAIVQAIMGSGKSAVIAEVLHSLSLETDETIVVTTPTVRLVDQLYEDITKRLPERAVGKYYTHESSVRPITVCCMPSAPELGRTLDYRDKSVELWIADEAHKTECETMYDALDELEDEGRIIDEINDCVGRTT